MLDFDADDDRWIAEQNSSITEWVESISPTAWAEKNRWLPASTTAMPGLFRFDVVPYMREILDCLGVDSPIRFVSLMKGSQIGGTVALLENCLGYFIAHVKWAPVLLLTADDNLAKERLNAYIIPMLRHSGLEQFIRSNDESNARKTGKTQRRLEWEGGGFALTVGVRNPNNLSSLSFLALLRDEIDKWPLRVGQSGDPMAMSEARTDTFEKVRKVLDISTPLIRGQSKIHKQFLLGDQRYYHVCCLSCGHSQRLRWSRTSADGEVTGIVWDTDDSGVLIPGSTRYLCSECGHAHTNDDKARLLSPENGAEWRPDQKAKPANPHHRSYHLSALYSTMLSWDACVLKYLKAFDPATGEMRDVGAAQVFYNEVLAEPWEIRGGQKVRLDAVQDHKRDVYRYGELPNSWAVEHCGGPVLLVVCTVDVHETSLKVAIWGWCRDRRVLLIDYLTLEGDTEQLEDPDTWGALQEMIETKSYEADDGKKYALEITFIDSGFRTDTVYQFAGKFDVGVYPVKGRDASASNVTTTWFNSFVTREGTTAYWITVDYYKDRWSAALKRSWDGLDLQPSGHFNAPRNATKEQLKELTAEEKRKKLHPVTNEQIGWTWHRPHGAKNELWDLLIYANAALEAVAYEMCVTDMGLDGIDWNEFHRICEQNQLFFS